MMKHKSLHVRLNNKIIIIIIMTLLFSACIIARLYWLQVKLSTILLLQSKRNFMRYESIMSPRGNIVDRNGILLATNRPVMNVYWNGSGNCKLSIDQKNELKQYMHLTHNIIDLSNDFLNKVLDSERKAQKLLLDMDISFEQLSIISESLSQYGNINVVPDFKRYYPYNSLAGHILGYIGQLNSEYCGIMGIEKTFEYLLKGQQGSLVKIINSFGKFIGQHEIQHALVGQNIQITIDFNMQNIAEQIFPKEYSGAFIVMDPIDGSIRALLSRPDFDPNMFLDSFDENEWHAIQEKRPFLNRTCSAAYPPGSIFKLITISAALENGIVDPLTMTTCYGHTTLVDRDYHCNNKLGHGSLSVKQAIAHSCNIPFFEMAKSKKIDIDDITDYAHRFGLGSSTQSGLPEIAGVVPSRKWKLNNYKEKWWLGETLSAAIGQSFLLVTPLQIARMVSAIETGYLVTPRIVESMPIIRKPLMIKSITRSFLKQAMYAGVMEGTAVRLSGLQDFTLYAKTSTAQMSALTKRKLGQEYLEHGWVVVSAKYKNEAPIIITMIVEHAGNTILPLMAIRDFLKKYKQLLESTKIK